MQDPVLQKYDRRRNCYVQHFRLDQFFQLVKLKKDHHQHPQQLLQQTKVFHVIYD